MNDDKTSIVEYRKLLKDSEKPIFDEILKEKKAEFDNDNNFEVTDTTIQPN